MAAYKFNPTRDIPDLGGKIILVTGGTAGLGRETVLSFAAHGPEHIYFTGRSQPSADKLIKDAAAKYPSIPITFIQCDFASLASVQSATQTLLSKITHLDIVIANAGVLNVPPGLTKDGYEVRFGTNHVGHALLVKLLTPLLEQTAQQGKDVRIVWLSSKAHLFHPLGGIPFDQLKTPQSNVMPFGLDTSFMLYGQSKLANLLYAREYARRHPSITSVSLHPGESETSMVSGLAVLNRWFLYVVTMGKMMTVEECAWNQQWAATASLGRESGQVESGKYYEPIGVKTSSYRAAGNDALAEKLWDWTQKELEEYTA